MDCWVIQAGRDLRRSLVQTPAQSRVTREVRPACSSPCPPGSWKPLGTETAPPLQATCSLLGCPCGERVFPFTELEPPLAQFLPVTSCPPTMHHCSTFLPYFHATPSFSSAQHFNFFPLAITLPIRTSLWLWLPIPLFQTYFPRNLLFPIHIFHLLSASSQLYLLMQ